MVADYAARAVRTGRPVGISALDLHEVEARKGGMAEEAGLLSAAVPSGAVRIALDERGSLMSSPDLARRIAGWRDGARDAAFLIGGADGLDPALRAECDAALSFGPMVWPHALVRVMLAEQLYRAASILAGTPYHRA